MSPYNSTTRQACVIDCDTGRDDALAILVARRLDLTLAAVVTSYGNVDVEQVTDNTRRVLHLQQVAEVPVFVGAAHPSRHHLGIETVVKPRQATIGNGICNIALPQPDRPGIPMMGKIERARAIAAIAERQGRLNYIILGPATNFAELCEVLGPSLGHSIASVTMMGGKFDQMWTTAPQADFNLACDPFAVRQLLACGIETRFVPINATWPIFLTLPEIEQLTATSPIGLFAKELMLAHCRYFAPEPVFRFHDPCAVLAALNPDFFIDAALDIICDESDPQFGRLIDKDDGFKAKICNSAIDFRDQFLKKLLFLLDLSWPTVGKYEDA